MDEQTEPPDPKPSSAGRGDRRAVTAYLTEADLARLDAVRLTARVEISRAKVIEIAIRRLIDDHEGKNKQLSLDLKLR
jgi:hypothetical protein